MLFAFRVPSLPTLIQTETLLCFNQSLIISVLLCFFFISFLPLYFLSNGSKVVGGWANNRTLIRRKRQDYDITVEYTFNALRKDDPLKLLIEISNGKC